MTLTKLQTGSLGEQIACNSLIEKGYLIIARNHRSRYGEIDIIARKDRTYVFVEVKCRVGDAKGMPYEAVTRGKIFKIMQTARLYVLQNNLKTFKLSVHVVSIVLGPDMKVREIRYFEDAAL